MSATERPAVTERRTVTVLFADMVESTATAATQDPERMRSALAVVFERASQVIAGHGGIVEKFIGDQIMAVFGLPKAHDDDPERAVRAGLAMHDLAIELSRSLSLQIRFRIGVNTGEVATGTGEGRDFLVTGQPVNIGSRLYPAAEPGGTVVGPLTRSLTCAVIRYGGPISIDGKGTGRLEAWPVDGVLTAEPGTRSGGGLGLDAPIIGRERELGLLQELLAAAARDRYPHLVTILGDAGVGKSRLIREFTARASAVIRIGRCLPYGEGIEYNAVRAIVRSEAGIDDETTDVSDRLRKRVATLGEHESRGSIADRLLVLAGSAEAATVLPSIPSEDLAAELRWAFRRFISAAAAKEPLVVVFEDLHWATASLLDLVEDLAARGKGMLLVCCLARPELMELRPGWGTRARASLIRVGPLDPHDSESLVLEILRVAQLPEELVSDLVERSGGNPLYLEELLRALIASGHLLRTGDGWSAASSVAPADVPDSLRGVITARLDRLSRSTRRLLQQGSVHGRYFTLRGARAIAPAGTTVGADSLSEAERSEFLLPTDDAPSRTGPSYQFRHALIRDAVYGSIAKVDRLALHERAADWIEREQAERGEEVGDLVAHHLERSYGLASELQHQERLPIGRRAYGAIIAVATNARTRAGRSRPATLSALYHRAERIASEIGIPLAERKEDVAWAAVIRHPPKHHESDQSELFGALALVRDLGPTAGLASLLGLAAQHAGADGSALAEKSIAVARATGDPSAIAWALWLNRSLVSDQEHERSWRMQEEALTYAREHGVRDVLAMALVSEAQRLHHAGELTRARALRQEAYEHAQSSGGWMPLTQAAMFYGLDFAAVHDRERMLPLIDEAIVAGRETSNAPALANALWQAAWGEWQNGLFERARDHAEESLTVVDPITWPDTTLQAHLELVRTYAALGDARRAGLHYGAVAERERSESERGSASLTHQVNRLVASAFFAAADGRPDDAEREYRRALEITARPRSYLFGYVKWDWLRSLMHEWLGDLLASRGRTADARESLIAASGFWSDPLGAQRRAQIEERIAVLR